MKRTVPMILLLSICGFASFARGPQSAAPPKPPNKHQIVTAAQANGVYRYYKSEFRILALGHNKLKVQFDGIYMTVAKSPNMGYAMGEATIEGTLRRSSLPILNAAR